MSKCEDPAVNEITQKSTAILTQMQQEINDDLQKFSLSEAEETPIPEPLNLLDEQLVINELDKDLHDLKADNFMNMEKEHESDNQSKSTGVTGQAASNTQKGDRTDEESKKQYIRNKIAEVTSNKQDMSSTKLC